MSNTLEKISDAIKSIDSKNVNVFTTARRLKTEEFCIIFVRKLLDTLKDKTSVNLVLTDVLVLLEYADRMQFGNQINISQLDVAEALNIDKQRVSRSVKKLIEAGIFYKEGRSLYMTWQYIAKGNLNDFILNNNKSTKSLEKQIKEKERELLELKMQKDKENGGDGIPF